MGTTVPQIYSKFNDDLKAKHIIGLKRTYRGVLLSIELNDKTSKIKGVKTQIENLIQNKKTEDKITIDGQEINVTLTEQNGIYSVKFNQNKSQIEIKNTGDYTTEDLLALCAQHELTIGKDNKGNYVFGVKIEGEDKGVTIGGPGKISIFPQHLSYVKEIIEHLEKGGSPITELALATGTGKTFIELLVEYLPARLMGIRYVSIAPDASLVTQKRSDWKKLLSDADINDIELDKISDKKGCSILGNKGLMNNWDEFLVVIGLQQLPNIIEALKIGNKVFEIKNGKINIDGKDFIISANEIQFDNKKYEIKNGKVKINDQEFEIDITKPISISFDEEHRVIEEELYKYRMELLSTLCPTLFLSATPSNNTYKRVQENGGLIKTLSLKDKMISGDYGALELKVHQKQRGDLVNNYIEELEGSITFKEKPDENKKSFYYEPKTNLTGEDLKRDIENYIFYNAQSVIGESALVLAESDNIKEKLKKKATYNIFENENNNSTHKSTKVKKYDEITNHLGTVYKSCEDGIIKEVVSSNLDYESEIHDYSAFRVMHGVIENTLSYLTGLSRSELDKARFANLEALVTKVKEKLDQDYNLRKYITNQGINSNDLVTEITTQMELVINILKDNKKEENDKNKEDLFTRLVRNWNQDKKLHTMMPPEAPKHRDEIMKLFGIKKKGWSPSNTDRDALEFNNNKTISIFQYLKDGYGVGDNIANIEKECNASYRELQKAEKARETYYDQYMRPYGDQIEANTPLGYFLWNGKLQHACGTKLSDCDKQKYESKLNNINKKLNKAINNPAYQTLVNTVSNKKDDIFRKFNKIKQQFQQERLYPLADLRKFSDQYRYIKMDDKDNDALLRMGLCGNYVNHKKIQGFNAIDLQHVVMLVDEKSSFINDPPQLIQGPGRLRCLNPVRLSILFCHSSDKLKFDIELLQKGNYIDAYNKVMEGNNKKSPEEFGNIILWIIEKFIKDGVSEVITNNRGEKFKEVDDLAAEVITLVIASFDEVYNNKGHNAKEAKDYFVKVLKHVTSKMEKQLKNEGITLGNLNIECNIRGIQPEIDNIINKIQESAKNKEAAGKKLQIDGNIIKRFFIKLYRLIRRIIGCRIELEKEKMKFEKEEKSLNQEKKKLEKEKSNLEKQIKTEKKQEFIGVMQKKSNVQEKGINEKEREDITQKQQEYLSNEIQKVEQEFQELKKEDKVLKEFEKLKEQIKEFASKFDLQNVSIQIDNLYKAKDQIITLMEIIEQLKSNFTRNYKSSSFDEKCKEMVLLNEKIENNFKELEAKKQDLEEVLEKKSKLEQYKKELNKKSYFEGNIIDYDRYYNDVVNKVLVCRSIIKKYDVGRVLWIGETDKEFAKVINNDYYTKLKGQYYAKHIDSCARESNFPRVIE